MPVRSVRQHYDKFLAQHYSWMFGDFEETVENKRRWFVDHSIAPKSNQKAIDLGCGSGFQSLALSRLGFKVMAVDFNRRLIDELKSHDRKDVIDAIQGDIIHSENYLNKGPFELAVCMGDTLPHLPSMNAISDFFLSVYTILQPDGRFVLSFRDYSVELTGVDRFIPVNSDESKIMTVFLEYSSEYVLVHDLLYERKKAGWEFKKSVYKKIRLTPDDIVGLLNKAQFGIHYSQSEQGIAHIVAKKIA